MKLLIKFPTRGRPEKFLNTLKLYYQNCTDIDNIIFLITIDQDDPSMNSPDIIDQLKTMKNLYFFIEKSTSKVDAVNRDLDKFDQEWDVVLLASDDMIPQTRGYDVIIKKLMKEHFSDTDGVLHFNDGYQKETLNTLCVLGKKYYNRFNYIYYPGYKSCWSDNEFMEVSRLLNKTIYFDFIIIRHEHPDWGHGNHDIIHTKNQIDYEFDQNLFLTRKQNNFNI
jgi:hypothetical protein